MSKIAAILFLLGIWSASASSGVLQKVAVAASCAGPIYLYYDEAIVSPSLESYGNSSEEFTPVGRAVLEKSRTDTLIISYSEGPSCDPGFFFFWSDGRRVRTEPATAFYSSALNLSIPGDGFFYTWGHTDSYFDIHRKFQMVDSVLSEVEQPYYSVGLNTIALKDLTLYADLQGGTVAAAVAAGDSIYVVLNAGESFLVRTRSDILGWWRMKDPNAQRPTEVEGIFFAGD